MSESINMTSMQIKIDGEYISLIEPLDFKWSESVEENNLFETYHDLSRGSFSFSFKTTWKAFQRKPKSKNRRIQKKYLKKRHNVFGGLLK